MNEPKPPGKGLIAGGVLIAAYLLLPLVVVAGMSLNGANKLAFPPSEISFRWYEKFATSSEWAHALSTSLRLAVTVALLATILGYLIAFGIDRGSFPGRTFVQGIVFSPLVVPTIVIAVAMYLVFANWRLVATFPGLVVAHLAMAIPYAVVNILAALKLVDRDLEKAARSLGAGPWRTFRKVTLPLTLPGVFAAAVFSFVISWDEIVVAIFISGPSTQTLPIVMWSQMRTVVDPTIAAVATCLMLTTVLAVLLGSLALSLSRRRTKGTVVGG